MSILAGIACFAILGTVIVAVTACAVRMAAEADRRAEAIIEQRRAEQGGRVNPPPHPNTTGATTKGGQHNGRVG